MLKDLSVEQKQQLLFAARIRFGPDFDVPREAAIDAIVERAIFAIGAREQPYVDAGSIFRYLDEKAMIGLHEAEIRGTLKRLVDKNRILPDGTQSYALTDENGQRLKTELDGSLERVNETVKRLFDPLIVDSNDLDCLRNFFLDFLCALFARFGLQWVQLQTGDMEVEEFLDSKVFDKIISEALSRTEFDEDKKSILRQKCYDFFRIVDPEFDLIKFNLGQSYYIAIHPFDLPLLPPTVNFSDPATMKILLKARTELGELKGYSSALPNPMLLLPPAVLKESVVSSRIENINTTVENVL